MNSQQLSDGMVTDQASAFRTAPGKHVLMITNHGIHQWQVIPGLPDTGGQNVFVNQFSETLAQLGFKITIVNRGGYLHPTTGELHSGWRYLDARQRILYLDDGLSDFVRKEDMHEQLPQLARALEQALTGEDNPIDLIFSHYWDGAKLGILYNQTFQQPVPHIWTPHSLGAIKKRNMPSERWCDLRIDERIEVERALLLVLDGVVATSSAIEQSLQSDYDYSRPSLFLPPCVDPDRYHMRAVAEDDPVWQFLAERVGLAPPEVRNRQIVTEISRTDRTKRKDVLLRAFAKVCKQVPNSLLVISIDDRQPELAAELTTLIKALKLSKSVAVVGSVWDLLPTLYAISSVYCTPSIMEGFGMSAEEAAASGVPVVSSHLVPFVTEYLLGSESEMFDCENASHPLVVGKGAIVVRADDIGGFGCALTLLLSDASLREQMGRHAFSTTIPYFTWKKRVTALLDQISRSL